jgi:hypothetical protein
LPGAIRCLSGSGSDGNPTDYSADDSANRATYDSAGHGAGDGACSGTLLRG